MGNLCYLTCLRHLIRSREVTDFFSLQKDLFSLFAQNMLPSNILSYPWGLQKIISHRNWQAPPVKSQLINIALFSPSLSVSPISPSLSVAFSLSVCLSPSPSLSVSFSLCLPPLFHKHTDTHTPASPVKSQALTLHFLTFYLFSTLAPFLSFLIYIPHSLPFKSMKGSK